MKYLILLATASIFIGCEPPPKQYTAAEKIRIEEIKDSLKKVVDKELFEDPKDTIGVSAAPIKVLSYEIVRSAGGDYRNIQLKFKNTSNKRVTAIKFIWKGVDAFGDPADMGNSFASGYGGGMTDDPLNPGSINTLTWSILSRNAKKVTSAWPIKAVFDDGTQWNLDTRKD